MRTANCIICGKEYTVKGNGAKYCIECKCDVMRMRNNLERRKQYYANKK